MSQSSPLECTWCRSTSNVQYCHDCTTLQCIGCTTRGLVTRFECKRCNAASNSSICATCGSQCNVLTIEQDSCSNCSGVELSTPGHLLQNLPTDYFTAVSKIKDISEPIVKIHNTFGIFIALVRQCRIARLKAFPQIEDRLTRCAKGIDQINSRSLKQLNRVKREALFELFNISYFKNIGVNQYRSAERLITHLEDSIQQTRSLIHSWCDQVRTELDQLYEMSHPLRKHFLLLQEIADFIPFRYHSIAAIVPPTPVKFNQGRTTARGDMYLVFTSDELIFLPSKLDSEVVYDFLYTSLQKVNGKNSSLKGRQLEIAFEGGKAIISGPPQVLRGIRHYFDLIEGDEPMLIGSEKVILKIEANLPDKNEVTRASGKFIEIFRDRLFGKIPEDDRPTLSMKELRKQFRELKRSSEELDDMVRGHKINLEDYRDYRADINDALSRLRDQFNQRGGHLFDNSQFRTRNLGDYLEDKDDDLPFDILP